MRALYPTLLFAAVLAGPAFAQGRAATQDIVDRARQARMDGRVDQSEQLLTAFLRHSPNHYRALYNLGLVYEVRAEAAQTERQRTAHYRTAIRHMERALQVRASNEPDYTIYNSLGVMYLRVADLDAAERNFAIGLENQHRLTRESRAKLNSNVGYLFATRGDMARAVPRLTEAAALGNAGAAANLDRLRRAGLARSTRVATAK